MDVESRVLALLAELQIWVSAEWLSELSGYRQDSVQSVLNRCIHQGKVERHHLRRGSNIESLYRAAQKQPTAGPAMVEECRSRKISLYATDREHAMIRYLAHSEGMSVSAWIRMMGTEAYRRLVALETEGGDG